MIMNKILMKLDERKRYFPWIITVDEALKKKKPKETSREYDQ